MANVRNDPLDVDAPMSSTRWTGEAMHVCDFEGKLVRKRDLGRPCHDQMRCDAKPLQMLE
jgi:hypothetical protein